MALLQNMVPFLDDVLISLLVRKWKNNDGKLFVILTLRPHKALKTPPYDKAITIKAWGTPEEIERELTTQKVQTQIGTYAKTVVELAELEAANAAGKKALGKKDAVKPAAILAKDEKTGAVKPVTKTAAKEPKAATPHQMAFMLVMTEIEDLKKGDEEGWKDGVLALKSEFNVKGKAAMEEGALTDAMKARGKKCKKIIAEAAQTEIA